MKRLDPAHPLPASPPPPLPPSSHTSTLNFAGNIAWFKAILLEPSKFEWKRLRHECELDDGLGMDGKLIDNL